MKLNRKARYARLKEITDIFMDDISCDGIEINHPIFKCMKKKKLQSDLCKNCASYLET